SQRAGFVKPSAKHRDYHHDHRRPWWRTTESPPGGTVPAPAEPAATTVIVVRTAACHYCADAGAALAEIGRRYPLPVDEVDAESPEGLALLAHHRPGMFALVHVDGRFFSAGRLPRGKLRNLLDTRQPAGTR